MVTTRTTALSLTLLAVALLGVEAGDGMQVVDKDTYASLGIESSDDVWLIEFYSDMCGSCKEFKPTFVELAGKFPKVKAGACNIDDEKGMALANQLGVLNGGIPHISLFGAKAKAHSTGGSPWAEVMVGAPQSLSDLEATVTDLLAKMSA